MNRSVRLLINSEPFGFGPTAAMADFFPFLRERFAHMAFIAGHHCLDLHWKLGYDAIYDISDKEKTGVSFRKVVSEYDLFFTACNFRRALIAHSLGVPTIIYDPLCWYWPSIPDLVGKEILYIAQDFFGVRELLENNPERFQNIKIVPPIIPPVIPNISLPRKKEMVLINLGGIQNPLWSLETSTEYAKIILKAVKSAIPKSESLIIATSQAIAEKLEDPQAKTYSREELTALFPMTKYAIMTPGLANIHSAACYDIPTLFLPPANDSQGLQLQAIRDQGIVDQCIDWFDIFPHRVFDYRSNQESSLKAITEAIYSLREERNMNILIDQCSQAIHSLCLAEHSSVRKIVEKFGSGGAKHVADIISDYAEKMGRK